VRVLQVALMLGREPRGDAEVDEPDLTRRQVHDHVVGIDVLMDHAALVNAAQRGRERHGHLEEPLEWERSSVHEGPERHPAAVGEHQRQTVAATLECEHLRHPGELQTSEQLVLPA
jgi:hypothetical protein